MSVSSISAEITRLSFKGESELKTVTLTLDLLCQEEDYMELVRAKWNDHTVRLYLEQPEMSFKVKQQELPQQSEAFTRHRDPAWSDHQELKRDHLSYARASDSHKVIHMMKGSSSLCGLLVGPALVEPSPEPFTMCKRCQKSCQEAS